MKRNAKQHFVENAHTLFVVPMKVFRLQHVPEQEVNKAAIADLQEKLLRARADLHNMQTRAAKDYANQTFQIKEQLLRGMLEVIDDFERALAEYRKQPRNENLDAWFSGFELIVKRLQQFLEKQGVREIDCSMTFDPQFHEALVRVIAQDKKTGDIVEVFQKGYLLNDRVLRPAHVSVAQ